MGNYTIIWHWSEIKIGQMSAMKGKTFVVFHCLLFDYGGIYVHINHACIYHNFVFSLYCVLLSSSSHLLAIYSHLSLLPYRSQKSVEVHINWRDTRFNGACVWVCLYTQCTVQIFEAYAYNRIVTNLSSTSGCMLALRQNERQLHQHIVRCMT